MKKLLVIVGASILLVGCSNNLENGNKHFAENNYLEAKSSFEKIPENATQYSEAQIKISLIDSILLVESKKKREADSLDRIERRQKDSLDRIETVIRNLERLKTKLQRETESLLSFNKSQYRNDVSALQGEINLFIGWAQLIKEAESSQDPEIKKLKQAFSRNLIALQNREFPILRKTYGQILKKTLWEQNMDVSTKGSGNSTIEFVAGMFADNKNKKDAQSLLRENLMLFRFKRANYKWSEYDDEYTYYSMESRKDSELVSF